MSDFIEIIKLSRNLHIRQLHEGWELLGFETRNKYSILDDENQEVAFAAEQSTGWGGRILRQIFGHWRSFKVILFDAQKAPLFNLDFPFRWFFKSLFVKTPQGRIIGKLQQRFAIFRKKFDVFDSQGKLIAQINSPFFKFWTFEFFYRGRSLGRIEKKWSGAMSEIFTDKDNFVVVMKPDLSPELKILMLSTCIMVDIIYFENNKVKITELLD